MTIPDTFDSESMLTEYAQRLARGVDCANHPVRLLGVSVHNAHAVSSSMDIEGRQLLIDFGGELLTPW